MLLASGKGKEKEKEQNSKHIMAQDISLENLAASQGDEMETYEASKGQGRSMGFGEGAEQNGTEQDEPEWDTCAGAP